MQTSLPVTGTPLFQLPAVVHKPSPASPVHESLQVGAALAAGVRNPKGSTDSPKSVEAAASTAPQAKPTTSVRGVARRVRMVPLPVYAMGPDSATLKRAFRNFAYRLCASSEACN